MAAAQAGYRPDEIRSFIPRDWILIHRSHAGENRGKYGKHLTKEEVDELLQYDRDLEEKKNG